MGPILQITVWLLKMNHIQLNYAFLCLEGFSPEIDKKLDFMVIKVIVRKKLRITQKIIFYKFEKG